MSERSLQRVPTCNSSVHRRREGLLYNLILENGRGQGEPRAAAALVVVQETFFNPTRGDNNGMGAGNDTAAKFVVAREGYWGPFIFLEEGWRVCAACLENRVRGYAYCHAWQA
eukprot:COSAG04_NODE_51_length_31064_cov_38.384789_23_plen_113_part_00